MPKTSEQWIAEGYLCGLPFCLPPDDEGICGRCKMSAVEGVGIQEHAER
jgi:hypothetical protein